MRVMIVEDQTMIRSLLENYFRAEDGYRIVASIPGAKQAVEVCRTSSVDLIFDGCTDGKPGKRSDRCSSDQSHMSEKQDHCCNLTDRWCGSG
ncbi:MAG: hypothetical protein V8S96_10100 [Lachnospiraceae bacterium]